MRRTIYDPITGQGTNTGGRDFDTGQLVDNQDRNATTGVLQNPTGTVRLMGDRDVDTGEPLNNGIRDWYTGQYRSPGAS